MNDRGEEGRPDRLGITWHDSSRKGPDAWVDQHQAIANELPIPPRRLQHDCWIPVTARLVWQDDGVELVDTFAFAWFGRKVLVEPRDRKHRRGTRGVWIHASDVRRRSAQQ